MMDAVSGPMAEVFTTAALFAMRVSRTSGVSEVAPQSGMTATIGPQPAGSAASISPRRRASMTAALGAASCRTWRKLAPTRPGLIGTSMAPILLRPNIT